MNKASDWSIGAQSCARQIVHKAWEDILCGKFQMPAQKEMEQILKNFIDYDFDEYEVMKKVKGKQPNWDEQEINHQVYKVKAKHDREYQDNLNKATSGAINEIENLLSSLNDTIRAWKIKNLG